MAGRPQSGDTMRGNRTPEDIRNECISIIDAINQFNSEVKESSLNMAYHGSGHNMWSEWRDQIDSLRAKARQVFSDMMKTFNFSDNSNISSVVFYLTEKMDAIRKDKLELSQIASALQTASINYSKEQDYSNNQENRIAQLEETTAAQAGKIKELEEGIAAQAGEIKELKEGIAALMAQQEGSQSAAHDSTLNVSRAGLNAENSSSMWGERDRLVAQELRESSRSEDDEYQPST